MPYNTTQLGCLVDLAGRPARHGWICAVAGTVSRVSREHGKQGVVLTPFEGRELVLRGWWRELPLDLRPEDDPGLSWVAHRAPGPQARLPSGAA